MATLARAITIAAQAHQDQFDKAGEPYVLHPLRMMQAVTGTTEKIVAVLHDVVEDSDWTFEQLSAEGFSADVIAALQCVTKRDGESYEQFVERAATNPVATAVKLADLEDNMMLTRLAKVAARDLERIAKYHKAWIRLQQLMDSGLA